MTQERTFTRRAATPAQQRAGAAPFAGDWIERRSGTDRREPCPNCGDTSGIACKRCATYGAHGSTCRHERQPRPVACYEYAGPATGTGKRAGCRRPAGWHVELKLATYAVCGYHRSRLYADRPAHPIMATCAHAVES